MANVPERDSPRSPVGIMSGAREMNYRQSNRGGRSVEAGGDKRTETTPSGNPKGKEARPSPSGSGSRVHAVQQEIRAGEFQEKYILPGLSPPALPAGTTVRLILRDLAVHVPIRGGRLPLEVDKFT